MQMKLLGVLMTAGFASITVQAQVTDKMIETNAANTGDLLSWGLGTQGQRYSPLKQVNTGTVAKLAPVWAFSFGGEKQRGQESQQGDCMKKNID